MRHDYDVKNETFENRFNMWLRSYGNLCDKMQKEKTTNQNPKSTMWMIGMIVLVAGIAFTAYSAYAIATGSYAGAAGAFAANISQNMTRSGMGPNSTTGGIPGQAMNQTQMASTGFSTGTRGSSFSNVFSGILMMLLGIVTLKYAKLEATITTAKR